MLTFREAYRSLESSHSQALSFLPTSLLYPSSWFEIPSMINSFSLPINQGSNFQSPVCLVLNFFVTCYNRINYCISSSSISISILTNLGMILCIYIILINKIYITYSYKYNLHNFIYKLISSLCSLLNKLDSLWDEF